MARVVGSRVHTAIIDEAGCVEEIAVASIVKLQPKNVVLIGALKVFGFHIPIIDDAEMSGDDLVIVCLTLIHHLFKDPVKICHTERPSAKVAPESKKVFFVFSFELALQVEFAVHIQCFHHLSR